MVIINNVVDFFKDIYNILIFSYKFITDDKISRLRIFVSWLIITLIPSVFIYFTINTWQVHIPNIEAQNTTNPLVGMIVGSSILPVLFFITKGLRGYHNLFNKTIEAFFSNFKERDFDSLEEEFGAEVSSEKLRKVAIGKHVAAFVILEFVILGWATLGYFLFGGNMTGLAWFGYVADDLLLGAIVFILEGIYSIFDGIIESKDVYRLKPITIPLTSSKKETVN